MTTIEWCFFNAKGELRSGWKFGLFSVSLVACWFVSAQIVGRIFAETGALSTDLVEFALNVIARIAAVVAATSFMAWAVDRAPAWQFVGFANWTGNFSRGIGIGAILLALLLCTFAVLGRLTIGQNLSQFLDHIAPATLTLAVLIGAAAFEELVFRGYPMQTLASGVGRWPAAAIMSALFGAVHAGNPNASPLGIINTAIAGLMLSAAYYAAGSLWLPYGIHLAWNVGLGMVLGLPVSGLQIDTLLVTTPTGHPLVTGGGYGPEGGLACTLAFGAGFLGLLWLQKKKENHDHSVR